MTKRCIVVFSLLFMLMASVATAHADSERNMRISVKTSYTGEADLEDAGSFSRTTTNISTSWKQFSFFYHNENYDWKDTSNLTFGEAGKKPFDNLQRIGVMYNDTYQISGPWFAVASLGLTSMFEEDFVNDNFTVFGGGMLGYSFSKQSSLALGLAGIRTPLKSYVFPMISARYVNGPWTLLAGFPKTEVKYAYSTTLDFRAAANYDINVYRLRDHSPLAKEGYLDMREVVTGLYADWKPVAGLTISAGPELVWGRSMKVYNDNEDRVGDTENPDAAWGGSLNISYLF
ncbi:hypothetical protein [Oleidesulfovibrio sp.]|uniref:hypothetical protein n=1 Tax=Oleidesulfovibrio sp. TaxID=2909707 RepID=UPI003A85A1BC